MYVCAPYVCSPGRGPTQPRARLSLLMSEKLYPSLSRSGKEGDRTVD